MTEPEWLACGDLHSMLEHLQGLGRGRKIRLFAVACCHQFDGLASVRRAAQAVDTAERFADGLAPEDELWRASDAARKAVRWTRGDNRLALSMASEASGPLADPARLIGVVNRAIKEREGPKADRASQIALLREIAGNPFRCVPLERAWINASVNSLAQAAHDHPVPSRHLDLERLAVLSDALEEAGCTDAEILSHLRSPGPHVRGCWALDLVLGRS